MSSIISFFAPAVKNTLKIWGTAGELLGNFSRVAGAENPTGFPAQQNHRLLRPGAILLPNLDIDETGARARFTFAQVDSADAVVNGGDDDTEVTRFQVREIRPYPATTASRIDIELDAAAAARVRIWKIPAANVRGGGVPVIGAGSVGPAVSMQVIPHLSKRWAGRWQYDFVVEALTLAGDPTYPAVTAGDVPFVPGALVPAALTAGGSSTEVMRTSKARRIYARRGEADVWLSLTHYDWSDNELPTLRERALLTIAPWLMTWNTLPCTRVYVLYVDPTGPPGDSLGGNHPMVWDLQHGCAAAGLANPGPHAPADSTLPVATNVRGNIVAGNEIPFYVIDGSAGAFQNDRWVQDEFEIGYCWAPHKWMHVAVHCPRNGAGAGLADFVESHMAHPGMGVFQNLPHPGVDSVDYGGNLEVSPPVVNATAALPAGAAGPAVPAHRAAPFGKIILGDHAPRQCIAQLRTFLHAQRVQPILPLDSSWLEVGHVDEILTFVRAGGMRPNGDYDFRLLFADCDALETLYRKTLLGSSIRATIHAGKYVLAGMNFVHDERFVGDVLNGPHMATSRLVQRTHLTPIRRRLEDGLGILPSEVIPVPCFFEETAPPPNARYLARSPGMVNMLVVGNHLMIPRPFGPRLDRGVATPMLTAALNDIFTPRGAVPPAAALPPAPPGRDGLWYWASPGLFLGEIAEFFVDPIHVDFRRPRREIMAAISGGAGLPAAYAAEAGTLEADILADANNLPQINAACPAPLRQFNSWMRVWVPDGRIDLTEAYMHSVLTPLGNTLHFIDDFECYHAQQGEVHCGTNARRSPPETLAGFTARWWDQPNYDLSYDTTY